MSDGRRRNAGICRQCNFGLPAVVVDPLDGVGLCGHCVIDVVERLRVEVERRSAERDDAQRRLLAEAQHVVFWKQRAHQLEVDRDALRAERDALETMRLLGWNDTASRDERYTCTAAAPWSPERGERATHPDAADDGECSDGCCDYYRCSHCGLRFRVQGADC